MKNRPRCGFYRTWFGLFLCAMAWNASALEKDALQKIRDQIKAAALEEIHRGGERTARTARDQSGGISGVSVALVLDDEVILNEGFGWADRERKKPASADTIYRVGSISKLFTAVGVMQQVEAGKLDLDAPIERYLPTFRTVNPFPGSGPITLRQLHCHRSGLIRESPVGGYFDDQEPTLAQSVASLDSTVLVNPPNNQTRYSNIGVSVAGQAMEKVVKQDFSAWQKQHILEPLGMKSSSFVINGIARKNLAVGRMLVADGKGGFIDEPAALFELGTIPAGNLYSTAGDLARFARMLLRGGELEGTRILQSDSLKEMFKPQLISTPTGFGIGFSIGRFGPHKTVNHNGAVYGFSSSFMVIPEQKMAVVVLVNEDLAFGPMNRLTELGLNLLLEAKGMAPGKPWVADQELPLDVLKNYTGHFESESYWADLDSKGGVIRGNFSGQRLELKAAREGEAAQPPKRFFASGRYAYRSEVVFELAPDGTVQGFSALGQKFKRVDPDARKRRIPAEWQQFLGSYGPSFIPLILSYKNGNLYAMTENMVDYRLTPISRTVFGLPPGMYQDEELVVECDARGRPVAVVLANMRLPRFKGGAR